MGLVRSALLRQPLLVLAIGLAALLLRLAVPAGFMPVLTHGGPALALCGGAVAPAASDPTASTIPDGSHHGGSRPEAAGGCAFADLAVPAIASAGLAASGGVLLFVLALGPWPAAFLPPLAALRLRPPLRGPPPTP